jgi:hypothetical protein
MTNAPSKLSPPTLHWAQNGPDATRCDLCRATVKPLGECFVSIRRAFSLQHGQMVESDPIRVLMCVECGWTRPYAPTPSEAARAEKPPQNAPQRTDGATDALPTYYDSGVMD